MPESHKAERRRKQKQNAAAGIGDENGRIPVRIKTEAPIAKCSECQQEFKITKTNTEVRLHSEPTFTNADHFTPSTSRRTSQPTNQTLGRRDGMLPLTMAPKMAPMPTGKYVALLALISAHSLFGGYYAATQPAGAGWRFFSWHPMLMMVGMVGLMGSAALTKKRGGYTNTKMHGIMACVGLMIAGGGVYVIYQNKKSMGKPHFTTYHSWTGLAAFVGCILPAVAGAVFLHPDWGIDKQNKLYRSVHKYASRSLLMLAWMATLSGLKTLIGDDIKTLILFAAPMVIAAPFTLM